MTVDTTKTRACAPLLPPPGEEVVRDLCDALDQARLDARNFKFERDAAHREVAALLACHHSEADEVRVQLRCREIDLHHAEAATARVRELHRAFRIYDDCGHEHTLEDVEAGRAKNVTEVGYVCEVGYQFDICSECCTDGEYQTEGCATDHDRPCYPCPTIAVLDAE